VNRSAALPAQFREQFIDGFSHAASTGLQVGQGQTGAATQLPPGVPAQVAQLLSQISHDVFVNAFLEAMKSTLYLPVAVVLLAAVVTLLLRRQAPMSGAAQGEAGATADHLPPTRARLLVGEQSQPSADALTLHEIAGDSISGAQSNRRIIGFEALR
jgi:hypothetical protein